MKCLNCGETISIDIDCDYDYNIIGTHHTVSKLDFKNIKILQIKDDNVRIKINKIVFEFKIELIKPQSSFIDSFDQCLCHQIIEFYIVIFGKKYKAFSNRNHSWNYIRNRAGAGPRELSFFNIYMNDKNRDRRSGYQYFLNFLRSKLTQNRIEICQLIDKILDKDGDNIVYYIPSEMWEIILNYL